MRVDIDTNADLATWELVLANLALAYYTWAIGCYINPL